MPLLQQLRSPARDRQLGLQLRDPPTRREQLGLLRAVRPGTRPRSMRSCRRQTEIVWALMPRSLATSATGRPASTRSKTLRRNSGGYPRLPTLRSFGQAARESNNATPPKRGKTSKYANIVASRAHTPRRIQVLALLAQDQQLGGDTAHRSPSRASVRWRKTSSSEARSACSSKTEIPELTSARLIAATADGSVTSWRAPSTVVTESTIGSLWAILRAAFRGSATTRTLKAPRRSSTVPSRTSAILAQARCDGAARPAVRVTSHRRGEGGRVSAPRIGQH